MKRQYFGTDGVRGPFGGPLVNPNFASRLAFAAARWVLQAQGGGKSAPEILIGRDTRFSGAELEAAVASGLAAAGCAPKSLGIVPTPAVSRAVRARGAALGVVITASHNPAEDNGIKFFGPGGIKLPDEDELAIEREIPPASASFARVPLVSLAAGEDYINALCALLPPRCLGGWRIVLDTANGATCGTSPEVLRRLGAELVPLGSSPDGRNINAGVGSEHPEQLAAAVLSSGARLGVAHDGDGDRCVLCDELGSVLDGDEIMAMLAVRALRHGALRAQALVVTVQSNLGLDRAVSKAGGRVLRTPVGDRYVIERMLAEGAVLGGESSGHIICSDISPTGDGLVAALKVIEVMLETGKPLSELRHVLVKFPQRSLALKVREKKPLETLSALNAAMAALERRLGDEGRLLVRYSGTEAKIRLLVEGPTETAVKEGLATLEHAVRTDLEVL
jgi:phosphoglucosamine mutase